MTKETKAAEGAAQPPVERNLEPLERDEYLRRRRDYDKRYREAIRTYDKLVPWGASGALFLSITFLEKIAAHPLPSSQPLLIGAWGGLLAALGTSMWSHYTSSRIFVCKTQLLDNRQRSKKAADADAWLRDQTKLEQRVRRWGRLTAILNPLAGWALVLGAALLAAFAFVNAPFVTN